MVRAASVTATLVYTYNAAGLRVGQSVDGNESTYVWDWATGLPEMLSEGDTRYLLGHDTLGWEAAGNWTYALPDALGSVRHATDGAGAVVAAREWTPYGVELNGAQPGLGFTGEWFDADVGWQYLRARWYAPGAGRFTQPDGLMSTVTYNYTSDNPVNRVDPSGYIDWTACQIQGDRGTCIVQTGDTLYKIAREINAAGVSTAVPQLVAEMLALNPQLQNNPDYVRIADTLTLHAAWVTALQPQNTLPPLLPSLPPAFPQPAPTSPVQLPPPSPYLYLTGPVPQTAGTTDTILDDLRHALSVGAEPTNFMVNLTTDAAGYWRGIEVVSPKVGFGIDALSQLAKDNELELCPAQRACRAVIAGSEGYFISTSTQALSIKASMDVFALSIPIAVSTGQPWLPPVALTSTYFGVYIPTNLGLSAGADWANENFIFAAAKLRPEDDTSWWCTLGND